MAAGATTPGRRVPAEEIDGYKLAALEPGEYTGLMSGYTGPLQAVFLFPPGGRSGHVTVPPHQVTEHDDGTITVSPSIQQPGGGWHGYLEHGVWREV